MRVVSVIVINMQCDTARLAHIGAELERLGLAFERFAAVEGARLTPDVTEYFADRDASVLSDGEIGCYASHLGVCRKIAAGEIAAPVLVLEDDVALAPDFVATLDALMRGLPADWDLVRLSNDAKHTCLNVSDLGAGRQLVRYSNVPSSAGAILWSRAGAQKFLQPRPRELPVDQDLRCVWSWGLDTYGVVPAPALRDRCGASRIDAMAPAGWRANRQRRRVVRARRGRDVWGRHLHGLSAFGFGRWFAAEALNLVARLNRPARVRVIR